MPKLSGGDMVAELQRRVTNLGDTSAVNAINRAHRWILRQGSYQFLFAPIPLTLTITQTGFLAATATLSADFDPGKSKGLLNMDGSVIQHTPQADFWEGIGYNVPSGHGYDLYTVGSLNSSGGGDSLHTFYFLPNVSGEAVLYFHRTAGILADTSSSFSDLPPAFDDLIIDLAEAEERRVYDAGDTWQLLLARAQDQIKVLLDSHRSLTQQPGGQAESAVKVQEETQVGRA